MIKTATFQITVTGVSSHGSTPHKGRDAIMAASSIILHIQTIVSRRTDPLKAVTVNVGKITAGKAYNIINDHAVIEGAVFAEAPELTANLESELREIAEHSAAACGCSAELIYIPQGSDDMTKGEAQR